jgi:thiamine phosphate synthase YjbQ (UPF0047 family)
LPVDMRTWLTTVSPPCTPPPLTTLEHAQAIPSARKEVFPSTQSVGQASSCTELSSGACFMATMDPFSSSTHYELQPGMHSDVLTSLEQLVPQSVAKPDMAVVQQRPALPGQPKHI